MRFTSIVLVALLAMAPYFASAQLSQTIQDDKQFLECLLDPVSDLRFSSLAERPLHADTPCDSQLPMLPPLFPSYSSSSSHIIINPPPPTRPPYPIDIMQEEIQNLDYSNVKSKCSPSIPLDVRCLSCLCALADVFAEPIANTGLPPINFASLAVPDSPEAELAQQNFLACSDVIVPALNTNGIQLSAFNDLQQCQFEQVPECLQ